MSGNSRPAVQGEREGEALALWVADADDARTLQALRCAHLPAACRSLWLCPRDPAVAASALIGAAAACAQWHPGFRVTVGPVDLTARPLLRLAEDLATLSVLSEGRAGLLVNAARLAAASTLRGSIGRLRDAWDGNALPVGEDANEVPIHIEVHPRIGGSERIAIFAVCGDDRERAEAIEAGVGVFEWLSPGAADGAVARASAGALVERLLPLD